MDIPVYVLCGPLGARGSETIVYATRIEITMTDEELEQGEVIVAPDIVAGELTPGESLVVDCDDILQGLDGRESFEGFVTLRLRPAGAFRVQVTYEARLA